MVGFEPIPHQCGHCTISNDAVLFWLKKWQQLSMFCILLPALPPPPLQREMSILLDRFRCTKRIQVYTSNHAHPNHPRSLVTLVTQNQPWSCSQLLMFHHHGRAGYGLTSGCVVDLILPWSNGASVAQKICGNKMSRSDLNMWEW